MNAFKLILIRKYYGMFVSFTEFGLKTVPVTKNEYLRLIK